MTARQIRIEEFTQGQVARCVQEVRANGGTGTVASTLNRGLLLRIGATTVSWVSRLYVENREVRIRLGQYPAVSVQRATEAHQRNQERISAGLPPETPAFAPTAADFGAVLDFWVRDTGTETAKRSAKVIRRHFGTLLKHDARLLEPADVREIVERLRETKAPTARKSLNILSAVSNFAIRQNLMTTNITTGITRPPRSFDRTHFDLQDLACIFAALDQIPVWQARLFIVIVLSGMRTGEACEATIADFNVDGARIDLPDRITKTGNQHSIALGPWGLSIIKQSVGERGDPDLPLFPNLNGSRITAAERADLARFANAHCAQPTTDRTSPRWKRLHSARRTLISKGSNLGMTFQTLDQMLNHTASGSLSEVARAYYVGEKWQERQRHAAAWDAVVNSIYRSAIQDPPCPISEENLRLIVKQHL